MPAGAFHERQDGYERNRGKGLPFFSRGDAWHGDDHTNEKMAMGNGVGGEVRMQSITRFRLENAPFFQA